MATPSIADWDKNSTTFNSVLVVDVATTLDSGSGAGNHNGKLIVILVACDIEHTISIDDVNYSKLFEEQNASDCTLACFWKAGVDSDSDPTVSIDTGNEPIIAYSFVIADWDSATPLFDADQGEGATSMVCPTVTATAPALVIRASVHRNSFIVYSAVPETEIDKGTSGTDSSTAIYMGVAQTTKNNEATGTATFTAGSAADWAAATIVVHGTAVAGGVPKSTKITLLGVG